MIVEEIARGGASDVFEAHVVSMKDHGFFAKPAPVKYRMTVVGLLTDVVAAHRARARAWALRLATSLPERGGAAQALLALCIAARAGALDEAFDIVFAGLRARVWTAPFHCPPSTREIAMALPASRRAVFDAALAQKS